jgi:hypothetical protein
MPPPMPPGEGALMSVEELWRVHMPTKGRNQVYELAKSGIFPFIRNGKRIDLLRGPTLAILRGERPPGQPGKALRDDPARTPRPRDESRPAGAP